MPGIVSPSEPSSNTLCVYYFRSVRFFVELMGLSTAEKVRILDEVIACGYDRARSLAIINNERKLR